MSFLKKPNKQRRLFLQLKGFLSNTYLDKAGEMLALSNFKLPKLELTETDLSRLDMPDNLRLGNRLERFFSFIIQESDQYELLAENLQINGKLQTIGELDFIIYDHKNKQVIHIELGGKVYLYDLKIKEELARWIGPNRRDSLLNKTAKLRDKQFPLLYHKRSIKILEDQNIKIDTIIQEVCFKARLFLPYYHKISLPPFVSKENIKGYYLDIEIFVKYNKDAYKYFIPKKQDWIVDPKYAENWYLFSEVIHSIKESLQKKQSPLVWVKISEKEYEVFIVVWW